jgi:hypothetical protein
MLRFQQRVHLLVASILIVPGDEFRMLDDVGGVARHSRDQDLPGEFHVAPDFVFMLVTDVAGFDPQSQFLSLDS